MSRRHHHHLQPYDYDRFSEHTRDRERERDQTRGIEYQDDSLSSINSDEESYLHHHPSKDKKANFYSTKNESSSKQTKADKSTNSESYHQKDVKATNQFSAGNSDATGERLARLEGMLEQLIKRSSQPPPEAPPTTAVKVSEKQPTERRGQFSLEPRRHDFTTSMWINKIQDVSIQNNWDEKTTISYMGSQMSGIIKAWYNSLPSYDYTWPEWKILISKMFPDNTDFITSLKRLVTRLKQADESMTAYYFSKMYLIEACKITGEDAVSCLIDGLNNQSIQEQAKSQNYLTPETLYSQFLTVLPEYTVDYSPALAPNADAVLNNWLYEEQQAMEDAAEISAHTEEVFEYEKDPMREDFDYHNPGSQGFRENEDVGRSLKSPPKRTAPVHSRLDKRFIRHNNNFRHQNKVPMAAKVCTVCGNRGHLARNCRKAEKMMYCKLLSQTHSSCLYKNCVVNGRTMDAFVDTGCTAVTIKKGAISGLDLNVVGGSNYLEIYGGGVVPVLGETKITLEVGSVRALIKAIVVPDHMQEVSVVIGQEFLNQKNVCMVLKREKLNFFKAPHKLTD
ncbi:uncharacterized protein LOC135139221 [Zophobas morio]|uniref:uncharacterized protein LOC135139221 n=1 Tax=Zophobas morio TaxID=2755281 RepID=UPI0030830158